jgi:chromosome segregation ATPase
MATDPPILTYTLEEVLTRFEQKMDRQFTEVNQKFDKFEQKMDRQFTEVNQKLDKMDQKLNKLEIGQAELSGDIKALDEKLSGEIKILDEKLSGEIKALDEKVGGIDKRLENQEFINRSVLVGLIVALIGGAVKLFSAFPIPKV